MLIEHPHLVQQTINKQNKAKIAVMKSTAAISFRLPFVRARCRVPHQIQQPFNYAHPAQSRSLWRMERTEFDTRQCGRDDTDWCRLCKAAPSLFSTLFDHIPSYCWKNRFGSNIIKVIIQKHFIRYSLHQYCCILSVMDRD